MKFDYHGQAATLIWYSQDLITASLDEVYGHEVLCRGFITATHTPIPMGELIPFLYSQHDLLLTMTCQQIQASLQLKETGQLSANNKTWVNLAGQLIADQGLFQRFWQQALCKLSTPEKHSLVLEICEDHIGDDVITERLAFLRENGFVIAMDDFGAGHSNLLRLSQSQFDIIKLDLKLLNNVPADLWTASFYREVVNLCASKGCMIVAEGVETQTQSDFVRWAGIDMIQGFLYSTPSPMKSIPQTEYSPSTN